MKKYPLVLTLGCLFGLILSACQPAGVAPVQAGAGGLKVLAAESFLADIAQNVAGDRLYVQSLIPLGADPHTYEPTPREAAQIAESDLFIINGAGFEAWLESILDITGGQQVILEASAGIIPRTHHEGETVDGEDDEHDEDGHHHETDPHFWLDPLNVVEYVENIRDGLSAADPQGSKIYARNAEAYIAELLALDAYIQEQIASIPPQRRRIVTNHESFGYFADRYGLQIIGTVLSSASSAASPSAQQMARLVDHIRETQAVAIFLETGANPQLAAQVAQETGVKVVSDLYTHSLTEAGGVAPAYIDMMKYNVNAIASALK